MKSRLTKAERETILLTSEADDTWEIHTFNTSLKKRLKRFSEQHPELCRLKYEGKNLGYVDYAIRKQGVSIHLIAPYSEERRNNARENAKKNGISAKRT